MPYFILFHIVIISFFNKYNKIVILLFKKINIWNEIQAWKMVRRLLSLRNIKKKLFLEKINKKYIEIFTIIFVV